MEKKADLKSIAAEAARMAAFIAVYVACSVAALHFFSETGLSTIFWPASGLGIAAVLIGGPRYVPVVLVAALISGHFNQIPWKLRGIYAAANALETLMAWFFVTRLTPIDIQLSRAKDYIMLILVTGVLVPIPGSFIAAAAIQYLTFSPVPFFYHVQTWWMGGSLGIILITPLILIWRKLPYGWFNKKRIAEALAGIALTFIGGKIFLEGSTGFFGAYPRSFVAFIFVSWAAVRFGRHATLVVTTIIVTQSIIGTYATFSVSNHFNKPYDFANIWMFLVTLSTVGMALATTFNERRTTMQKLSDTLEAYRNEETRRRQSDVALTRTSIDFQRLVETAEEGVWTIDTQGKTTFVNRRMAEMLGYTSATMYGKPFTDFMKPARREAAIALLARRNAGIQEAHEFALEHKEGHEIWTLASTNPITDIEGNITGALAMITDISGNRKTEQALHESEERFRKIVEEVGDSIIIHQSGFVIYTNPAGARMMGAATPAELIGRNGVDFTHPDSRSEAVERIQKLMQQGPDAKLPPFKRKVIRIDGKVITVESTGFVITYEGRQAMVVIGREVPDDPA